MGELATRPYGRALIDFFTTGDGVPEAQESCAANAFVVLRDNPTEAMVGTLQNRALVSTFELAKRGSNWQISSWGECEPGLVRPPLRAARWYLSEARANATQLRIKVEGGECVGEPATGTQIHDIVVTETRRRSVSRYGFVIRNPNQGSVAASASTSTKRLP